VMSYTLSVKLCSNYPGAFQYLTRSR